MTGDVPTGVNDVIWAKDFFSEELNLSKSGLCQIGLTIPGPSGEINTLAAYVERELFDPPTGKSDCGLVGLFIHFD